MWRRSLRFAGASFEVSRLTQGSDCCLRLSLRARAKMRLALLRLRSFQTVISAVTTTFGSNEKSETHTKKSNLMG